MKQGIAAKRRARRQIALFAFIVTLCTGTMAHLAYIAYKVDFGMGYTLLDFTTASALYSALIMVVLLLTITWVIDHGHY